MQCITVQVRTGSTASSVAMKKIYCFSGRMRALVWQGITKPEARMKTTTKYFFIHELGQTSISDMMSRQYFIWCLCNLLTCEKVYPEMSRRPGFPAKFAI